MYEPAVENGIPAQDFWSMTLEEILVQVEANQNRQLANLKQQASMDYRLSQAMIYAVNDPSKMPTFDTLYEFAKEELTEEEKAEQQAIQERQMFMQQLMNVKQTIERRKLNE